MIKAEWTNDDALSTGQTTQTNDSNALNALDCISRQAAIGAIEEYADRLQMVNWKENPNVPYKVYSLNWCINTIRDLPSIDAVPIIRCKDCIHSTSQVSDDEDTYYCNAHYHGVHSLEFCNHGERKEE